MADNPENPESDANDEITDSELEDAAGGGPARRVRPGDLPQPITRVAPATIVECTPVPLRPRTGKGQLDE